jgi:hypothetical protein
MNKRPTENVYAESGCLLWSEPYYFKRLSAPGEVFIRDYVSWMVLSCREDGDEITTVVRRVQGGSAGNAGVPPAVAPSFTIVDCGGGMRRLDMPSGNWWRDLPSGTYTFTPVPAGVDLPDGAQR